MGFTIVKSDSGATTAFVNGLTISVAPDHPAYQRILAALSHGNGDEAIRLSQISERIANYVRDPNNPDLLRVQDGIVYFKGEEIKDVLTDRIVEMLKQGQEVKPIVLFFENLWQNPSFHSRNQLYNFLQHHHLPLTDDGCFIAYKRVRDNFTDFWTGTFDNSVGKHVRMDRNRVDDDWSHDCSYGLHVGSIDFVRGFNAGMGHVILVKVNPRDAVSVPQYTTTKMRVCDYDVLEECNPELLGLEGAVYTADGVNPVTPVVAVHEPVKDWSPIENDEVDDDDEDEDWEDDEDDSDEDSEEVSQVPLALLLWCESVGLAKDSFVDYFNDPSNANVRNAWGNRDGVGFVTHLYANALQREDENLRQVLDFGKNRNDLAGIVKG